MSETHDVLDLVEVATVVVPEETQPAVPMEPSVAVEPTETKTIEPTEKTKTIEPSNTTPLQAVANHFEDVIHSCVRTRFSAKHSNSIPLCHNALENVTTNDVLAYQADSPVVFAQLETQMASIFEKLHTNDDYRLVGLYFSLLAQDINLLDLSAGQLAYGKSGEVAQRLTAVMQQSLRVREKRQFVLPHWVIGMLCLLGFLCFVSLCVIGGVVHHFMKKQ